MEEKIVGTTTITSEEYRELIEELEGYRKDWLQLNDEYCRVRKNIKNKIFDSYINWDSIEITNKTVVENYTYNSIKENFFSYEIFDEEYIKSSIYSYKKKLLEEELKKKEEGESDE